MITRTFHPIGQGAFYSDKHGNFNVIYDCGNWKNTKASTILVINSFKYDDVLDVLFLSHFDYDHVNKLPVLLRHFTIKNVILKLLHDNVKHFLKSFIDIEWYHNLIVDPQKFFDKTTVIFY